MALIAHLFINDQSIGAISATRTVTGEDGVNEYRIERWAAGSRSGPPYGLRDTRYVAHRYDDGAEVLLRRALEEFQGVRIGTCGAPGYRAGMRCEKHLGHVGSHGVRAPGDDWYDWPREDS